MRKPIYIVVMLALILSLLPPARVTGAVDRLPSSNPVSSSSRTDAASAIPDDYSAYLAPPDSQPLLQDIPEQVSTLYEIAVELQQPAGPYRTTVTIRGNADLARLKKIGVTILSSTKTNATVIADRLQLEQLAKLSFQPRKTELTDRLQANGGARLPRTATSTQILAATAADSDGDGLDDTEEGWWCTDPSNPDSDNDKVKDGDEVVALTEWVQHKRATRPSSGKPFAGWPPNHTGCYDSDYDSVPDAVEVYVFGLNPNRESTARDKFDDGQKLFGLTNCPGSGGGCGYGALPRQVDWGVIFAEMPSWVKPPYDSPFVAAFPDPDVTVVPSSYVVTAKTTITTDHMTQSGEAHTYGTAETRGTSTSVANTTTWNNWQEVAITTPNANAAVRLNPTLNQPQKAQGDSLLGLIPFGKYVEMGIDCATLITETAENCRRYGDNIQIMRNSIAGAARTVTGGDNADVWQRLSGVGKCLVSELLPGSLGGGCERAFYKDYLQRLYAQHATPGQSKQEQPLGGSNTMLSTDNQNVTLRPIINMSYPAPIQLPTTTETHGRSWGGAQTTTHTEYEEHTISQADTKQFSESWGNATALDTVHAADLSFTYRISNQGTDYAREIGNIAFNIYIGDDPNPVYTYFPAADIGGTGTFSNFMPGETHTYASRAIPLTLNQMKAIDTGSHIFVVVEDFGFGVDELFYQDSITSGATFAIDSGDGLLHTYVLPTWGIETIQDVTLRFFPATMDSDGNLLSLTVSDYSSTPAAWKTHKLTGSSWWNVYMTIGTVDTLFKDTPASGNSTILIRMSTDSDLDGYNDRDEIALGKNPNDPVSHPDPQLVAATHSVQVGSTVTVTMAFLNSGNYDAYGIEATMYAPDSSVTINDHMIGGNGRVKSATQVVLGSRIMPVSLTNWRGGAKPYSTGSYSGSTDEVFTFTAANPGNVGNGTVNINWNDGVGNFGTVNVGSGYQAPLPVTIRDGLQIGFDTGTVNAGDVFTVSTNLPRDTFTYTINQTPYTTPVVVISYNDPQGNHKFVTPIEVSDLGTNLGPYASQMLNGVGIDIATTSAFKSATNNTIYLNANSPHPQAIESGHLLAEFIDEAGTVVGTQVFTQTLRSGPNVVPLTFNSSAFNPAYETGHDYTLLAFFTDSQGNIIDLHARLFSTFGADPQPILNTAPASWNFGSVTQGAQPRQTISIVNTGIMPLNVVVASSHPKLALSGASGIISVAPAGTREFVAILDTTALSGAVSMSITIRSNDPAHQTVTVPVNGTVTTSTTTAAAFEIVNRPLDKTIRVYGTVPQFSTVDFTHGIQPDTLTIEPCRIFDASGTTLKGVGRYCTDFSAGTAPGEVFGNGQDGDLTVTSNTVLNPHRASASGSSGSTTLTISNVTGGSFLNGQGVLIHQTRGGASGLWEMNRVQTASAGQLVLQSPLANTYITDSGAARAQVIWVPEYRNVTINSGVALSSSAWDGSTGGILAFLANAALTVNGTISAAGLQGAISPVGQNSTVTVGGGFRGGQGICPSGSGGAYAGESSVGYGPTSISTTAANGSGGGHNDVAGQSGHPAGGGAHATAGTNGSGSGPDYNPAIIGKGGSVSSDTTDLTTMLFGAGGGGSFNNYSPQACASGGSGGGIIFIGAASLTNNGTIVANGGNGNGNSSVYYSVSGAGAGGSVLIKAQMATLGTGTITAIGGTAPTISQGATSVTGGSGGVGRIRIEYQNLSGSIVSNPSASVQQVTYYIAQNVTNISFGTGADGPLTVAGNQSINTTRSAVSATSAAGQPTLNVATTSGFALNQEILIHQTQGAGAGNYEFGKIAGVGAGTLTLQANLQNTYTQGGNSHAQVVQVPQYTTVTVQSGGVLSAPSWDGTSGGIIVFRATGQMTVDGAISINGSNGAPYPADNVTGGAVGGGYRGGNMNNVASVSDESQRQAFTGEGYIGPSVQSGTNNGNGGAGGRNNSENSGAGGGHAFAGENNNGNGNHPGGGAVGDSNLTTMFFGGGGGGGSNDSGPAGVTAGSGGSGGGIIYVSAKSITVNGTISSNGGNGGNSNENSGGGAGAGGAIVFRGEALNINNNKITSTGGTGGTTATSDRGGNGSVGRVRVEYCDSLSGSTNPVASAQKLNCYIAEKPDPSTIHFTVPDALTNGQNYVMQFGRRLAFSGAGNQLTYTRVVSQTYANVTMDLLVSNVGAGGGTNLTIDFGDDGTVDYTYNASITQPTALSVPNVTSAFNAYITSHTATNGNVDVPMRVAIDRQADVMLTNMAVTPGAGLDLVVSSPDLVIGCPGGPSCLASEGNTVPISVTVRNNGAQNASSAVVGYYVGNPQAGGRLLGNSYVATIPAGGNVTANYNWDTTSYTHTQTLYAFVDPPNAIAETLETNNVASQTLYIKTKPDLRVASISFERTDRVVGEPINAAIVVANGGETDAPSSSMRVTVQGERGDSSGGDLATATIPATSTITLNTSFVPGKFSAHVFTATADIAGVVSESVESNNLLTRTIYVGLDAKSIDAGGTGDTAYNASNGWGFLNGLTYDFGGAITKTVRYDGNGNLQYRFDGLQPSRSYHLDATFYQEGETFSQNILFDGINADKTTSLISGTVSTASLLVPAAAYTDTSMIVTFQRPSAGAAARATRFRTAGSTTGPAFVSEVSLIPIEYTYLDAGGASDVAYDSTRGYGYVGNNTAASNLGGQDALSTYRTVFGSTLYYQFDRLNAAKSYLVDLTMYDGNGSTRVQSVTMDSQPVTGCTSLPVNTVQRVQCPIDPARYTGDGIVIAGVVCSGCTGPRVNEIALEEKTRDVVSPSIPPPPTPPPTESQTNISSFAALWSGSVVQVTWATTAESKVSSFELYRSNTVDPAAWTLIRTQASQSNCASSTTPFSYGYTDSSVVAGQTYYYKLTWSGLGCGGAGGSYPANAVARPGVISAIVSPNAGGSLSTADGNVQISFPANAVTTTVTIIYTELAGPTQPLPKGRIGVKHFTLEARTNTGQLVTNFSQPYTLILKYTHALLRTLGLDESTLNFAYWDGTRWVNLLPCSGCSVDRANDRVTIIANHFTEYALSGTNYIIDMPVINR